MKLLKFAYVDEFSCIGPECTDSCCKYWSIIISKREYLDYKKMDCSPKLRRAMEGAFLRLPNETDVQYAQMHVKENGDCPFLDNDSLCMLQKEKGEEALGYTCNVFPRLYKRVGDKAITLSMSPTCCHVTEILMNHPEGLQLVETEYNGENRYVNQGKYSSPNIPDSWKGYSYYWSILNGELDILQNRNFTVPERMLILGYFCQKTEEYIKNNVMGKIIALSDMLLDNELCRKIVDSLTPAQSDNSAAAKSVSILQKMYERICTGKSTHLIKLFDQVINSISLTAEKDVNTDENGNSNVYRVFFNIEQYNRNLEIYRKLERERPYIIENLLVNLVFSQNITDGVWTNYFSFAVFYNIIKICVPAFLHENYDDKALANAITQAVKMVLNSSLAKEGTFRDFEFNKTHTLPYVAFLIC